jgi:hypothetical protein
MLTLIGYAHQTGYYQATLEKVELNHAERKEYDRLNREAIESRKETWAETQALMEELEQS